MKIALIGYGKMGRMIEEVAISRGHQIVSVIDVDNHDEFMSDKFDSADVAIEFTTPATAADNIMAAMAAGVPVVSGTTGWLDSLPAIKQLCEEGRGTLFYSSNYSLGVNIFHAVNRYLTKVLDGFTQYTPQIEEIHHIHKLDHPSGTAITIAENMIDDSTRLNSWSEEPSDDASQLLITHKREDEVPGIHTVTWRSAQDQISLRHEAFSRHGLALGAVLAAEWLAEGRKGFFTMQDMLNF